MEKKVANRPKGGVIAGTNQRTIDSMMTFTAPLNPAQKRRRTLRSEVDRCRSRLDSAIAKADGDVDFVELLKRKSNRNNNLGEIFKGIGKKKILDMMGAGVFSARQMLAFNDFDSFPEVKPQWKTTIEEHYHGLREEVEVASARLQNARHVLDDHDLSIALLETPVDIDDTSDINIGNVVPQDEPEEKLPAFSDIMDPNGWNVHCPSKSTIDRVTATYFASRKEVQVAKMQSHGAEVVKIDWTYKIAPKIKVYTGRGECYAPHKTCMTVFNENGICIFFKFYPGSEIDRAIKKLQKKYGVGDRPPMKEIMKEAKAIIPPKAELQKRVQAVLSYMLHHDWSLDAEAAELNLSEEGNNDGAAPMAVEDTAKRHRFFIRNSALVSTTIKNQMSHVKLGCLSDPPKEILNIHLVNPYSNKAFTVRSTGINEVDNRALNRLFDIPSVGIARADRMFWEHYERVGFLENDIPSELEGGTENGTEAQDVAQNDAAVEEILADPEMDLTPLALDVEGVAREVRMHLPSINLNETTMQTFTRLTEKAPWVPFSNPTDRTSTAVDVAEFALFEELRSKFDRHGGLYGARGYHSFARRWDMEVAKVFNARIEAIGNGLTPPPLICRKTYQHLQEHYDRCNNAVGIALLANPNDPNREEMERALAQTRRTLPPHQEARMATAPGFRNHGIADAPFGNPTVMNTTIAAGGMMYTETTNPAAPYVVRPSAPIMPPLLNPRGFNFKDRQFCVKCGFSKSEHLVLNTVFGNSCSNNCLREECSKCLQRLEFHSIGEVGPYCSKTASPSGKFKSWWKEDPIADKENGSNII
ncbi:hypothetical protein SEMRO_717_G191960.1 [Seminavis robusta]|uniref:Uncharacterized protein n=1 Tax=Seminavis robusta TaxID=568900 RepID=A0A9N8E686_9STRA|nr:hypothetical protein SEMRO_717_G191960.1 [Seminavis robusta]|eukprot:Sro717_g191960.1 n/a (814) ;mRNA; r:887-3853